MFPLLDLDDDALAATLGFSDPRTLCSATMTCRRLRILADAAWVVLDKHIPSEKWEGGTTPRERVLSSFVVHERKRWLEGIAVRDLKAAHLSIVTPEQVRKENHLLYVRITDRSEYGIVGSFFRGGSDTGLRALNDYNWSIDVPIQKEQLTGQLKSFVQTYTGTNTDRRALEDDMQDLFRNLDVAIFALNRRTLKRHVFFRGDQSPKIHVLSCYGLYIPYLRCSKDSGSRRVDIEGLRNWLMTNEDEISMMFRTLELQFYFKGSEFGLKFSYSRTTM